MGDATTTGFVTEDAKTPTEGQGVDNQKYWKVEVEHNAAGTYVTENYLSTQDYKSYLRLGTAPGVGTDTTEGRDLEVCGEALAVMQRRQPPRCRVRKGRGGNLEVLFHATPPETADPTRNGLAHQKQPAPSETANSFLRPSVLAQGE